MEATKLIGSRSRARQKEEFITASATPMPTSSQRVEASALFQVRNGWVQGAKIAAADAILNQATPRTPTAGNSNTAKDGPR